MIQTLRASLALLLLLLLPLLLSAQAQPSGGSSPLTPESFEITPGFTVELVYAVPKETQGSWVSLCAAPGNRFYACDQGEAGIFRVTVGDGEKVQVEKVPVDLSGAQGLLWAFDSLWAHRNGGGLYRLRDTDGDDQLDHVETQPSNTRGGGEHGSHGVILSEDSTGIYIASGNYTELPPAECLTRKRVQSWQEDHIIERMWDARGHARGRVAPGGWVTRYDPESKTHDLISMGYRNHYDLALNLAGDLFTYDADMEWDMGTPWYRPTRINHVVSGSDYGWRSGSGKWPVYYEDSLPPAVVIGPGSPTGFVSGQGAKFPATFQQALFALDWTFGTIWAVHLQADGASYTGTKERFLAGAPLPVTDAAIGQDGHFYFTTGGRGTQSGVYRVRYTGTESTAPAPKPEPTPAAHTRKALEAYHGVPHPKAVDAAWPHLASPDRFLRHAARVAIESQAADTWAKRVYGESRPQARITAAVALARAGQASHLAPLLDSLLELDPAVLPRPQALGLLRAYALCFARLGEPAPALHQAIIDELDPLLPHSDPDMTTELVRLLSHLEAPSVVPKTIPLLATPGKPELPDYADVAMGNNRYGASLQRILDNHPPSREIGYALMLRHVSKGWTPEHRRTYFQFLSQAARAPGGASYPGFLTNIRDEALASVPGYDRTALADLTGENFTPTPDFPITPPKGPGKAWTLEAAVDAAAKTPGKPNFEQGRNLFFATACGACHRMGGLGGSIGPDLTSIPNKFDTAYVLEAIIDPSKDISNQYGSSIVTTPDGSTLSGIAIWREDQLEIFPHDITAKPTLLPRAQVKSIAPSPVSQMPPGLINSLNPAELRDLTAYLMSGGNAKDPRYK